MGKLLLYATVFVAIVITGFVQKSNADNAAQCNALVEKVVAHIKNPSASKNPPEFVVEMKKFAETTLAAHVGSSIASVNSANVLTLEPNEAKATAQAIKDEGVIAIEKIREHKLYEFGSTYGGPAYTLATEQAPNTEHFSQTVSSFCTITLGDIDGLKTKIVADIHSFEKRINQNTPACETCNSIVTEILAKIPESNVGNVLDIEGARAIYYKKIFSAAKGSKTALTTANGQIHKKSNLPGFQKHVNIRFMYSLAISTIDLYKEVDMDIFMNIFPPRLQQLFETGDGPQSDDANAIRRDMANLCNVALDDYKHIHDDTIERMITALPK